MSEETNLGVTANSFVEVTESEPEYTSHSNFYGAFDYNNSAYAKKNRFVNRTYTGKSSISGYGVFASEDIAAGELIEEFPVIILDTTWPNNKDNVIQRYAMTWDCNCSICQKNGKSIAIMLGNGSIYNHSEKPNAYIQQDNHFKIYRFFALSDIKKGSEITWYYSSGYAKTLREENKNGNKVKPEGLSYVVKSIQKGYQVGPQDYQSSQTEKKKGCGCRNGQIDKNGDKVYQVPMEKVIEMGKVRAEDYEKRLKEGKPVGRLTKVETSPSLPQDDKPEVTIVNTETVDIENFMVNTTPDILNNENVVIQGMPEFRSMVVPENKLK